MSYAPIPSISELASDLQREYDKVEPFRYALDVRVADVLATIKDFIKNNSWYSSENKFYWVLQQHEVRINDNNLAADGVYFDTIYEEREPAYLSFSDMENIDTVLVEEYEKFMIM